MALKIGISSYVSPGFLSPVIWRLYETGTGTFVDEHQELGPHGVVYNFDFVNNLRDVVYTIKFFDQPGGVGVGNLIKSHDVTVSTSTITFDADIEYVVDGGQSYDPISGTSITPANANLIGKDFYVEQRGIGKLLVTRNIEVTIDNVLGRFSLLGGNTFNAADTFIVKIRPQYVVNPPGSQGLGAYKDVVLITADTTLAGTDFGKLFIVDGSLPVVTIQLPPIANILAKLPINIQSVGTAHINVVIKAALGETITATGATSNTFILGRAMNAQLILLSGILYGFTDDNDIKKRGQIEWGYYVAKNRVSADGTHYLIANYPGLKKAVDDMPATSVVTEAQWNSSVTQNYVIRELATGLFDFQETKLIYPYKGKFAITADGLSIIVPDLRNKFIRGLKFITGFSDSERITQNAGGYQLDDLKGHGHAEDTSNGSGGNGKSTVGSEATEGELYTRKTGGSETRGENIGLIPLIII